MIQFTILLLAALLTPPDPASFLLVAVVLEAACLVAGVMTALSVATVLRRRLAGARSPSPEVAA